MLTVVANNLPATAAPMKADAYTSGSQQLAISADASAPIAARDAYVITQYTPVQWPIPPSSDFSDDFGPRASPCRGCSSDHQGVDFLPGYGTPIASVADGVVVQAAADGGLGQHVVIEHSIDGQMVQTVYGHMIFGSQTVQVGDTVTRGQVIGRTGSTGQSTGPHMHFEVRPNGGEAVDPFTWLAANVTEAWTG